MVDTLIVTHTHTHTTHTHLHTHTHRHTHTLIGFPSLVENSRLVKLVLVLDHSSSVCPEVTMQARKSLADLLTEMTLIGYQRRRWCSCFPVFFHVQPQTSRQTA